MSDSKLQDSFATEEQYRDAPLEAKRQEGFSCPSCGRQGHGKMSRGGFFWRNCRKKQVSSNRGNHVPLHQTATRHRVSDHLFARLALGQILGDGGCLLSRRQAACGMANEAESRVSEGQGWGTEAVRPWHPDARHGCSVTFVPESRKASWLAVGVADTRIVCYIAGRNRSIRRPCYA